MMSTSSAVSVLLDALSHQDTLQDSVLLLIVSRTVPV